MDQTTIDTYNELAWDYDAETIDFWEQFPPGFIKIFQTLLLPHSTVLDIGSGPGRDAHILKQKGLLITCLDASETMIGLCKEKGLKAVLGDLLKLPFPDGMFDGAWAYTSFLHVRKEDMPAALAEARRILKPGGIFALGMIEGDTEEYRTSSGVGKPRLFSFYRKEGIERLLTEAGFQILHFESFKPGSKNYLNFIAKKS